jgi:hypothetical protein
MLPFQFHWNGDNAYPLSESVMIPYSGNISTIHHDIFNFYHSQCRIVVECLFGMFIARWGIFWRDLEFKLQHVVEIVHACLRLHNFCTRRNLPILQSHYDVPAEFALDERGVVVDNQFRGTEEEMTSAFSRTGSTLRDSILREIRTQNIASNRSSR